MQKTKITINRAMKVKLLAALVENYLAQGYTLAQAASSLGVCTRRLYELAEQGIVNKSYTGPAHQSLPLFIPEPAPGHRA